ncbi:MAG: alanyl-tRNA editing protein [Candidatus Micrarchaeota archaeon]|nr:alanyl-tRNA editing protein [Candidatus Micrarchaeota archaeon]MDE1847540.1 alanyl-tRNA editing protein [Candidatus Micrarchaeota archaeon]MDE1864257.1 alanyl-tRNA editing protein [Candidatus Micrarchaeota archaeon]
MMEKLYWKDAYAKEFDALVTRVEGNAIYLDRTAFYPVGGGQPCDTGTILVGGKEYRITEVSKDGEDVKHMSDAAFEAKAGDKAHGKIDWEKRHAYMKLHTALHLLDALMINEQGTGMITGGQIYQDRARIDIDGDGITREKVQGMVDRANEVIRKGRDVLSKQITREDALANPILARTQPGRKLIESLLSVRVVEIAGLDEQIDGGTHVSNVSEIGRITLGSFKNNGRHHKRIEIKLS